MLQLFKEKVWKGLIMFALLMMAGIFFSGCSKLNVYKIRYNPEKQVYEYPLPGMEPATLRTNSGELVTEKNFEQFIAELAHLNFKYPFDNRLELANSPKESDYQLASMYSESVLQIQHEEYTKAADMIKRLEESYPKAIFYSDLAFLKGYVDEMQGRKEEAKNNYNAYLSFSSQKFSERFREHRYADPNNTYWLQQRAYALDYLSDLSPQKNSDFLRQIKPKYYFTNLQPGFTLSDEGLVEHSRGIFSVSFGTDLFSNLSGGFQYYRNFIRGVDINPEFSMSRNMWELRMAIPVQVYRSGNNRFGIKVSPFGQYSKINSFRADGLKVDVNESVFNYGVKTSMGFFIIQRLSLGAYYTYNYYNANRPFNRNDQLPEIVWENEYDVSLYFPLMKGLNLKGGIKSGDWVAGLYLPGWEVSFNLNEQKFILRTEMY